MNMGIGLGQSIQNAVLTMETQITSLANFAIFFQDKILLTNKQKMKQLVELN